MLCDIHVRADAYTLSIRLKFIDKTHSKAHLWDFLLETNFLRIIYQHKRIPKHLFICSVPC